MTPAENRVPVLEGETVRVTVKGRVLVAIPCFNEEQYIGEVVRQARITAEEVLVIDDGSTDRTAEVAAFNGATVIRNPGNKGKGYGIRRAFEYAFQGDFDALLLMDGDMQHDPAEIPNLVAPIVREANPVDLALGFRFGNTTEMPWWRRIGKRVLDYATAIAGAGIVTDSQCGYRAFGKRAIVAMQGLSSDGFAVESEQLVIARRAELSLENVHITCKYEGLDGSTKDPVSHAAGVLKDLVKIGAKLRPVALIGVPSVGLTLVASILLAIGKVPPSGVFVLAGGVILLGIGIIGIAVAATLKVVGTHERRMHSNPGTR